MTRAESTPPDMLRRNDVTPRIKKTKPDFKTTMVKADFFPRKNRQYIVTIFDKPSFTPGGSIGIGGIIYSTAVSAMDSANKRLRSVRLCVSVLCGFFMVISFGE